MTLIKRADAIDVVVEYDVEYLPDKDGIHQAKATITKAEPSDLVSRADAIEAIQNAYCKPCKERGDDYNEVRCRACEYDNAIIQIDALPSAEAEWVPREHFDVLKKNYDMLAGLLEEAKARAIGAWIPVSERLPETHTEYVTENPWMQVTVGEDTYQLSDAVLGYGRRKHHSKDDPMMSVVWYEDDGGGRTAWQTAPDCEDIEVIAWMPLPEPYREKSEVEE